MREKNDDADSIAEIGLKLWVFKEMLDDYYCNNLNRNYQKYATSKPNLQIKYQKKKPNKILKT